MERSQKRSAGRSARKVKRFSFDVVCSSSIPVLYMTQPNTMIRNTGTVALRLKRRLSRNNVFSFHINMRVQGTLIYSIIRIYPSSP